jgi:tRNA A37 threonylcarbamoyladenosine dehydratase
MDKFDRCKKLFQNDFDKLQKVNILILGVGGVGGVALDCLYRSGINNITIIDFDKFDITNFNRQIGSEAIGEFKVEVLAKKYPGIKPICKKIDMQFLNSFDFDKFDYIIDAIDDIKIKVELIVRFYKKLISSGGSAKRIDPFKIEYKDIFQTYNDPFLKKIRQELKKKKFNKKFKVVFSTEEPICNEMGSFIGVSASFGLKLCAICIKKVIS